MKTLKRMARRLNGTWLETPVRFLWMRYLQVFDRDYYLRQKKSERFDRALTKLISQVLRRDSGCIDVGAYYGGILKEMVHLAPEGRHFAFEPNIELADRLRERFPGVTVMDVALSDESGEADYYYVPDYPAQSGLQPRPDYPTDDAVPEKRRVSVARLDDILPGDTQSIALMKIDAEGADYRVIRGATRILDQYRPVVAFEFGRAARHYGVSCDDFWALLVGRHGYTLYSPVDWLEGRSQLSRERFQEAYDTGVSFYFGLPGR